MEKLSALEIEVMKLPDAARAVLASRLLDSLPQVLSDPDEGIAEAMRRDAEMDRNPDAGITFDVLMEAVRRK
jgi:hypothetical protein